MNRFFRGGGQPILGTGVNTYRPVTPSYYPQPYVPYTMPQPQQIQPQNPMQTMIPNQTNIIWVDSESEIANYPSGRGWQQWFGDKNDSVLYIRDTDSNGVPQPIVKIRYEVIEPNVNTEVQEPNAKAPKMSSSDGPSREEFDKLSSSVNLLLEKLGDLLK